ncbi:MAG: elongation factor 4 [Candidatus Nomurabacteria bacterium]|jgi:GTP-binding protein LepA|nr:elongation factor 4 [Candidatus Nomurabacteria bacterium]
MDKIRNFCIIAHIDHGKSTLADRLMEITGTVDARNAKAQLLDSMELEREKGITIKLAPVTMEYRGYELNLIDTPGHVDFSYEVSRSLAACEGAILVVDATQGIQAQTLANVYLAIEADLTIIPVINKIDLPAADTERVSREIVNLLGCSEEEIIKVSAKTGMNVERVLEEIIEKIPSPYGQVSQTNSWARSSRPSSRRSSLMPSPSSGMAQEVTLADLPRKNAPNVISANTSMQALIFDSYFDDYRGVVLYVRVKNGEIHKGDEIKMMATGVNGVALEVGKLKPQMVASAVLRDGEIGYIVTNLKTTREAKVGDTVTLAKNPAGEALQGYKNVKPFVYAGFFPVSNEDYDLLKEAVEKLAMSDSALAFELESSPVLGFGLRIGFLGLLHMDIIKERLEREYGLDLVITNPSTDYHIKLTNGEKLDIKSASDLPDAARIAEIAEPWIRGEIIVPKNYVGAVLGLINGKRGHQTNLSYIDERSLVSFEAPLANLLTDFYDQLKSLTSGYGSFNYDLADYRAEDLVRIDFLVAGEMMPSLSIVAHRTEAEAVGREVVKKLKEVVPRQNFAIALQAAIGGRIVARETVGAYMKDVLTKIHTGDRDRKAKLLDKQKKGKKRMKKFGKVEIPAEAFMVMLKRD